MAIKIKVEDVDRLGEGIWRAQIRPNEFRVFGTSANRFGEKSVVILSDEPDYDKKKETLELSIDGAQLVNMGIGNEIVIILASSPESTEGPKKSGPIDDRFTMGDKIFLSRLPADLRKIGKALLEGVRRQYIGDLIYHHKSRKFVETPDNFWTVTIQPRKMALRITVYGQPQSFEVDNDLIELNGDLPSYSAFKVQDLKQINAAVSLIHQAYQMKAAKKQS